MPRPFKFNGAAGGPSIEGILPLLTECDCGEVPPTLDNPLAQGAGGGGTCAE